MTSTEARRERHQYSDLVDEPVDEYVGVDSTQESARCEVFSAAQRLALATCAVAYLDREPVSYWSHRQTQAYELVHRLGGNTYEESFLVPFLRGERSTNLAHRGTDDISEEFERLKDSWQVKSARMSVVRDMVILPEYQRIIGFGLPVLPLIIDSLREEPDHWFWALTYITGENPAVGAKSVKEAANRWIAWYDARDKA